MNLGSVVHTPRKQSKMGGASNRQTVAATKNLVDIPTLFSKKIREVVECGSLRSRVFKIRFQN